MMLPRPDHRADGDDQGDDAQDEPTTEGHAERPVQTVGLMTYPTPRTVWIIGSSPTSIFLRR